MNELSPIGGTMPAEAQERLAKLAAQPTIETWTPSIGETIVGVLAGSRQVENPYGQQQTQLIVQTPTGYCAVWLSQWLKSQLQAQGAAKGSAVRLDYLGKKRSSRGTEYGEYSLAVSP